MTFKTFYENINLIIERKKKLEQHIYTNSLVRKQLENKNRISQVDFFGKIENAKIKTQKEGNSILSKYYKNKDKNIPFELTKKTEDLNIKQKQLILLNKVKGGCQVFHSGFSGFTPNNQVKLLSFKLFKSILLDKNIKRRIKNCNFLISKNNQKRKLFHIFRAPFKEETLKVNAQFSKPKFKKQYRFRKINKGQLNFVYIFGKYKKSKTSKKNIKKQ